MDTEYIKKHVGFFGVLTAPIRTLARGHVVLVLFTASFLALSYLIGVGGYKILEIALLKPLFRDPRKALLLTSMVYSVLSLIIIPLCLVGISLPFRAFWFDGKLTITNLLDDLIPSIARTVGAIAVVLGALLVASFGISGLIWGARFVSLLNSYQMLSYEIRSVISVFIVVSFSYVLLRSGLNLLIMPFLALNLKYSNQKAIASAPILLRDRRVSLGALLSVAGFLVLFILNPLVLMGALPAESLTPVKIVALFGVAWYFIGCVTVFLLDASDRLNTDQVRILRSSAPQISVDSVQSRLIKSLEKIKDAPTTSGKPGERAKRPTTQFSPKDLELILR